MKCLSWSSPIWFSLLVLAGLFVTWAFDLTPSTRVVITQANFDKIQKGMSEGEVEAILGGPPGNYSTAGTMWIGSGPWKYWVHPEGWSPNPDVVEKAWIGDDILIRIDADRAGQIIWKSWEPVYPGQWESKTQRLWRRISGRFKQKPGVPPWAL